MDTDPPLTGAAHEDRARAFHLAFDYVRSARAYENAYSAYRREGDLLAAARAARTLGWFQGSVYGEWAVYQGWMGRALSLLERAGEQANEHGWVLVTRAQRGTCFAEQKVLYLEAIGTARRFGDADLECEALASLGIMLVFSGHVVDGMTYLDEALGVLCADEVEDLSVAEGVFCGLFHACERTQDVARAEQWLRAADDVVRRRGFVAIGGYCRAYYGGLLTAAGRWAEAEAELTTALRVFPAEHHPTRANLLCRLAGLRLGQGRVEEAAHLLTGLAQHDDAVHPLVVLHLARRDTALARDLLDRTLATGGLDEVTEGRLLALLVEVLLAAGHDTADVADGTADGFADAVADAEKAADRLAEIADDRSGPYLAALAAAARGRLCLALGADEARTCLHQAVRAFDRAQLPVETARAQLDLARALATSSPAAAVVQARAALGVFTGVAAAREVDAAAAVLRSLGAPVPSGPRSRQDLTGREQEVLELVGHGLNNTEIGARLHISPKTVEHHVGRILAKLALGSRAQAVAHAASRRIGP